METIFRRDSCEDKNENLQTFVKYGAMMSRVVNAFQSAFSKSGENCLKFVVSVLLDATLIQVVEVNVIFIIIHSVA